MQVIPAIDILDGKCVRLRQGDYEQETVYSAEPAETARGWVDQGATYVHVVDLAGAAVGGIVHQDAIAEIGAAAKACGATCQLGGGIRDARWLGTAFSLGMDRVIIGTAAVDDPEWFAMTAQRMPGKLLLGIDAKDGMVAVNGWKKVSNCSAIDLAKKFEHLPLAGIIYTDISRDGMLTGPNFGAIKELAAAVSLPIIASGGIGTLGDIRLLNRLPVAGCIVGRALYDGKFTLQEALDTVNGRM